MSLEEHTTPPCFACSSHDELEEALKRSEKQNATDHNEILIKLDRAVGNIKWMRDIGTGVLATMLGYYIIIGYHVFNNNYATVEDVKAIHTEIKEGEILHYSNENDIAGINAKLDMLVEHARKVDK